MRQTAVEWLQEQINKTLIDKQIQKTEYLFEQAKEIEKQDIDNKVIHFAEWLTKKHITALITLYEQFEEQYYNETFE